MDKIKTLIIQFSNILERYEIPLFRGAVIASLDDKNILFHNHLGNKFRYLYPLIQYKRIHKKAAIICVSDGTEAIGEFFSSCNFKFKIGERDVEMEIEDIKANQTLIQCWNDTFEYRVRDWLALNSSNYELYNSATGLVEKTQILERVLTGNILSFLKGVGIHLSEKLQCDISSVAEPRIVISKGVKLMGFDIEFKSNISLPDFIGLGKNASIGYGILTRKHNDKK
jgi:hypothetical protein